MDIYELFVVVVVFAGRVHNMISVLGKGSLVFQTAFTINPLSLSRSAPLFLSFSVA